MFSGAQVSLYPKTGDLVGVIICVLDALDPCREGHVTIDLTVSANSPTPR